MIETVLLVEPDGANENGKLRTVNVRLGENMLIERCHLDPNDPHKVWIRTWVNTNGERDLSGRCRVFREELPPPPPEEKENPIYDELVLKQPLTFGVDGATFKKIAKKYGKK